MKRLIPFLALSLLALPGLRGAELTTAEIARADAHLAASSAAFLASIDGLSDAQLNFKTDPNRWSVAEVGEHVASAEDFIMGIVTGQVMPGPARTKEADVAAIDEMVLTVIPDRSSKVRAPEPLIPGNRFGSASASREHFVSARANTVAFLHKTQGLRDHAADSPLGVQLDGYQWILFISAHTVRHTKQIDEVKAHPDFPKG